ncbi:DUF1192 domain-containing protein [Rhizobium sp. SSA_523]|uniref:DUF1192 domain-containing protein n=1 Tax=Rhizobium sp. SSA_523 TaxID=2952477 RepID=UPI002090F47A|nr:DUF1192 domain-containing protein [Rhizobium sp. SSA_523]MCO5731970.1 DUF1192 domain-containing protein [Rhizobium sp. SSA_523]WKC22686.1 DUF1192 domain-containing protein [Rhizobium sp. SSA_523]
MSFLDDEKPKKQSTHEIGSDLSELSVEELDRRISALQDEIVRLQTERAAKEAGRKAADGFFKR